MHFARAALAALVASVIALTVALSAVAPANARKIARELEETPPQQKGVLVFRLKGNVYEPQADGTRLPYAKAKIKIQKKACGKCKWKTAKQVRTNNYGGYKTSIYAPFEGKWKWRVRVPGDSEFRGTTGRVWALRLGKG